MGASTSSVWYNLRVPHPTKEVPILDYDLALLFQPMLLLGITVGVALSVVFPYWLITVLIIILFLGQLNYSTYIFTAFFYQFNLELMMIYISIHVKLLCCSNDQEPHRGLSLREFKCGRKRLF